MINELVIQTKAVMEELKEKASLKKGDVVVVGCSTSEIIGSKIGTNSSPEVAKVVFEALHEFAKDNGINLAFQCCEHLNRAIVVEKDAVPYAEAVNVIPQPKAGGSFATAAYNKFKNPVAVEYIKADLGLDIGLLYEGTEASQHGGYHRRYLPVPSGPHGLHSHLHCQQAGSSENYLQNTPFGADFEGYLRLYRLPGAGY